VVASLFEFNHRFTLIASLPALFLGLIEEFVRLFVMGALSRAVPPRTALWANLGVAATTPSDSPTIFTSVKAGRLDPFTATF
jgi:hypothetical protein